MLRNVFVGLVALLLAASSSHAQEWATKMFNTTSHDFGSLARGAKAKFHFQIKNIYEEDVHITGVRASCKCTTPVVTKADLKTFETAEIIAELNTRDFLGNKSATITVDLDCLSHAQVQLHITSFIRSDVVLEPGSVDLGTVDLGQGTEKTLRVTYAGRDDWEIVDVKTADPHFEVEVKEVSRSSGKTAYDLLVRLTKDAPVGYIKDQLILVTNDARARELPVDLQGRVMSKITISPAQMFMGAVRPGQTVTKNLIVRAKEPFKILDIKCPDKSFKIEPSPEAKAVHSIPVVFTAGDDPGRVTRQISITTDQGDNVVQAFTAYAMVVKPEAGDGKPRETADDDDAPAAE